MPHVLDRFEGQTAVLQALDGAQLITLDRSELPAHSTEGDVLVLGQDGRWIKDQQQTQARRDSLQQRFFSLFR